MDLQGSKRTWVVGVMVSTTVVKFGLMVYCRTFSNEIVRTFAQDHLFDVITNVIGLTAALLASAFYWWIDPAGAILVRQHSLPVAYGQLASSVVVRVYHFSELKDAALQSLYWLNSARNLS